jgi:hypothetical protein
LSDLQIDGWLAHAALDTPPAAVNDYGTSIPEEWRDHLAQCEPCRMRLDQLHEQMCSFATGVHTPRFVDESLARLKDKSRFGTWFSRSYRWRWRWPRLAVAGAGAMSLLGIVVIALTFAYDKASRDLIDSLETPTVRVKGARGFRVFVKRGESVFEGEEGGTYYSGDRLRFKYSSPVPIHLSIHDVEAATRRVTRFVPEHRGQPLRLEAGYDVPLPGGILLDEHLGQEHLVGVFCKHPYELKKLEQVLASRAGHARRLRKEVSRVVGETCTVSVFTLHKAARP